jgi:hypothetical protein
MSPFRTRASRSLIGALLLGAHALSATGCFYYGESEHGSVPPPERFPEKGFVTLDTGEVRYFIEMRLVADTLQAWDVDARRAVRVPRAGFYLVRERRFDARRTAFFGVIAAVLVLTVVTWPEHRDINDR